MSSSFSLSLVAAAALMTTACALRRWPLHDVAYGAVEPSLTYVNPLPAISPKDCDVPLTVGDGKTEATATIQHLLDTCTSVSFLSGGRYLSRSVTLTHSNTSLLFHTNSTLEAWSDINTWNATAAFRDLIWSDESTLLQNVSIVGLGGDASASDAGRIFGHGAVWWPYMKTIRRPKLVSLPFVQDLLIQDMLFEDSPSFHIQVRGDRMTLLSNRVEANMASCDGYHSAPNTDAYNVGGTNIYGWGNFNHNGDDGIPTNVGPMGSITRNVVFENHHSECGTNSGVVIIGGGGPGRQIHDVVYRNFTAIGLNQGAGMKISEAYENVTGTAVNVTWTDFRISKPRDVAIYINVFEEDAALGACRPAPNASSRIHWLTATNFTFENIVATDVPYDACFNCDPVRPCTGINLRNVKFDSQASDPFKCFNTYGSASGVTPQPAHCFQ